MGNTLAIQVSGLQKTYREGLIFRKCFQALKGISFDVRPGEIFGLLGPNGAGKTTFVKIMLGIVRKTQGTALMLGRPAGDRLGRKRVGYLPESLRIPRHLNANTALDYYGQLSGMASSEIKARRGALLESVGLAGRERDFVRNYSKGMAQRLGLAQAILHDPDLLFLDEPTDGLDPVGRSEVRTLLQNLKKQGKTVFLNSHLLQEVEMVCDRVAILDKGELRGLGTTDEIARDRVEGIELELEIRGNGQEAKLAIGSRPVIQSEVLDEDHFQVVLRLSDQAAVDGCVDDLRRRGLSIAGLRRRRVTLEDAFLQLLEKPASKP